MRWAVLLALALHAGAEELTPRQWAVLKGGVRTVGKKPMEFRRKAILLNNLAGDDRLRSAKLLVEWFHISNALSDKLERAYEKKRAKFERLVRKSRGGQPKGYYEAQYAVADAQRPLKAERMFHDDLAAAVARFSDTAAVSYLLGDHRRASKIRAFRKGVFLLCRKQPAGRITPRLCAFARDAELPDVQLWVLRWIEAGAVKEGFGDAVACLGPGPALIQRTAVAALLAIDDPRAVPALIRCLKHANGTFALEVEQALHRFTGKNFKGFGAAEMWAGWWASEGEAWLKGDTARRYEEAQDEERRGAEFYGIHTRSTRIVFVLDRSHSMLRKIERGGPVSGSTRVRQVPGRNRIQVAKNQLARTVNRLHKDVRFAVMFYGNDRVDVWRSDKPMALATDENKRAAIAWFMKIDAAGNTPMFPALHRALDYARSIDDSADTIFLLSDGYPTYPGKGKVMLSDDREAALAKFLKAARPWKVIVHTIGVGPSHSRLLMERLAEETGGKYRAVGVR